MRRAFCAVTMAVGAAAGAAASDVASFGLPEDLASYRSWKSPTELPVTVEQEVSVLCAPALPRPTASPSFPLGGLPHASAFIRVYANEAAYPRLVRAATPVPVGAVIAKAKLASADGEPVAVAFMLKSDEPRFRETGGWEFRFYPPSADTEATHQACAACHRSAGNGDFVFGHGRRR
jgi:hypothetical protein